MRLTKMAGKEILNINNGSRLGIIGNSDLLIDEKTGKIISLLVPDNGSQFIMFNDRSEIEIPWEAIKKIGNDMLIIDMEG
ncbi:YlmC/YmxH family sporulation protein [Abyssisolibacter fermentans]|uniref:YlmC/YmxH family sporulation protein n=1 Tax=Abyssisolibacter fermentans TaxID=1766203 RepID=UPI00082BB189|nr:YlmC/YmxH family sporulation protein [Abyssisolibacter fermentans]